MRVVDRLRERRQLADGASGSAPDGAFHSRHLGSQPLASALSSAAESLLPALLGGRAGSAIAAAFGHLDLRVVLFALLLSIFCGIAGTALQTGPLRMRRFLVVAEVALSLVLLVCGGLLLKTLYRLQNQDMGFLPESVLTAELSFNGVPLPDRAAVLDRVSELPGIVAAAFCEGLPPGGGGSMSTFSRSDRPLPEPWHRADPMIVRRITPGYFSALGTALHKGRFFHEGDSKVAIVNETLVRRYFPGENALGKQIHGTAGEHWKTIVGIVADAKNRGLNQPPDPEIFLPFAMNAGDNTVSLVVRGAGDPVTFVPPIRATLRSVSLNLPVTFRPMQAAVSELLSGARFNARLFGSFAAVALLLALVGIYGVLAYTVVQRTKEIGIRMALGARTPDIVRLIVYEAMALTLSGVGIGLAGAVWASRVLTAQLYDVRPNDMVTFATVTIVLVTTALLAAYLPAHRASRVLSHAGAPGRVKPGI